MPSFSPFPLQFPSPPLSSSSPSPHIPTLLLEKVLYIYIYIYIYIYVHTRLTIHWKPPSIPPRPLPRQPAPLPPPPPRPRKGAVRSRAPGGSSRGKDVRSASYFLPFLSSIHLSISFLSPPSLCYVTLLSKIHVKLSPYVSLTTFSFRADICNQKGNTQKTNRLLLLIHAQDYPSILLTRHMMCIITQIAMSTIALKKVVAHSGL